MKFASIRFVAGRRSATPRNWSPVLAREPIDPSHAFYLGYELAKAATALTLGKNYVQDQALRWGLLTVQEESHRAKMKSDGP